MSNILIIESHGLDMVSYLPLAIVLTPIIGSLIIGLSSMRNKSYGSVIAVFIAAITVYLTFELFFLALQGYNIYFRLPEIAGIPVFMKADLTGAVFALFTSIIWLLAVLASFPYIRGDIKEGRYYTFLILSLGGCAGVFLCGDFMSLFLFFELMTFAAYALVVHNQSADAMKAGANYLYLGIIGGLALLSGIIILNSFTGSVVITQQAHNLLTDSGRAALIALLMIAGFGVKAGMVPLHIWLPQAHPVAPAPASALLSGIMIKTGAYGIIRVVAMLYSPAGEFIESPLWHFTENLGHIIIWMGIMTMFLAALMALIQNNAKRLLAYSSISQMGYILMGIGAAGYLGYDGAMAFGGFSYHIINHAFFKSSLFILFGFIYTRLHEVNMDRLGGLWRSFPFTFTAFLVCAFGITGIPGFNGYASKTLLHHAIVEAFEHHHLWDLWAAEKVFMLTSGLTVCYIIKLVISIFGGQLNQANAEKIDNYKSGESWVERLIALSFIGVITFLGLNPDLIINRIIVPMSAAFTYNEYYVNYLAKTVVWNFHDLMGIIIAFTIGIVIYLLARKKKLFLYKPPAYLSVEYSVYRPATGFLGMAFTKAGRMVDDNLNKGFHGAPSLLVWAADGAEILDSHLLKRVGISITIKMSSFFNSIYESWLKLINLLFGRAVFSLRKVFMAMFKFDYSTRGDRRFQTFNISNIDFDLYIVLIFIGVILATSLLFLL